MRSATIRTGRAVTTKASRQSLRTGIQMIWLMGSNPVLRQQESADPGASADQVIDDYVAQYMKTDDANDLMYQVDASHDYDPGPGLEKIEAPLLAVNSADDLINPPELGILEREIKRVPHGRAIIIPFSERTHGHGSHTYAVLWKQLPGGAAAGAAALAQGGSVFSRRARSAARARPHCCSRAGPAPARSRW